MLYIAKYFFATMWGMSTPFGTSSYGSSAEPAELPCKDKLAFDTQKQANASAVVVKYQHGSTVHPYVCRHCGLWHLASGPGASD